MQRYSKTSNKQFETSFFLSPISPEDAKALISTLKVHKAIRPDSIPTIIKKLLLKPLTNLINLSFSTGLFPKILKQAKIIPIFKKGDQQDCNNYRPILLLSNISKIIEKLVHRQLYGFLEFNKFLYTNRFGFCNLHSKNYVLITITEKIRKAIDNGEITYSVFLDLQKALILLIMKFSSQNLSIMVYVEYQSYGLKLFSLNNTNMFPSKILYQKLLLMIMVYHKARF